MLKLSLIEEYYDETTEEFVVSTNAVIELEHSLLSMSKWESKYCKPFLSDEEKTNDEVFDYILMMLVDEKAPGDFLDNLNGDHVRQINEYIESPQSATTFGSMPERKGRGETITSELIYYWMATFSIPFECEKWHLNRLFALIRICNIKNSPPTKVSAHEQARRNRELNEARKAKYGTRG